MIKKSVLEKIKKSLLEERSAIMAKTYSSEVDIDGDETDEIQGKIIAVVNQQFIKRDAQKILKIENALKRLEDKNFGLCEECDEPIAEKRLQHNPEFSNCISCAEQLEFNNKQHKR